MSKNLDGIEAHIVRRYDIQKRLGKGAYGIVWRAIDKRSTHVVALKKIFDAFQNATDAQRTFREIVFLQEFGTHDNIIKLLNVIKADNDKDIYLVFEYMDTDLYNANKGGILQDVHKKYIIYQIFKAVKYLHSGNVIHRDLKPSNILLNEHCFVKVCDFGLARSLTFTAEEDQTNPQMTDYVATRWYRAPEILLGSTRYTTGIDMWSIGCIMGELLSGKPVFAGTSTLNQLDIILSCIEEPSKADIDAIKAPYTNSIMNRQSTNVTQTTLAKQVPNCPGDAMALMRSLLHFNPDKRSTAEEGCRHAYCKRFANEGQEMKLSRDIIPPLDDDIQLTASEYRIKLYEDIVARKAANKKRAKTDLCENLQATQLSDSPDSRRKSSDNNQFYNSQANQQQPREEPVQHKQEATYYKQEPAQYASNDTYYPATSYAPQAPYAPTAHAATPYAPTAPYATNPTAATSNTDHGNHYRAKSAGVVEEDIKHYKTKSHLSQQQQQQQQQLRSQSAGIAGGQKISKPESKYGHGNHGKTHGNSHGNFGNSGNYGNSGPDLTVCSSRMVPNNRSSPAKAGKRSVGGPQGNPHMPPRYGSSTHQHGTVTKDNLSALKSRQWL